MSPLPTDTSAPGGQLRLTDCGLIEARGADAASFLHGQLTQDVTHLTPGTARLAGYCSAKGRLLATFTLWAEPAPVAGEAPVLWLACSAELLPATLKRLQMFVLRAKCKLADASATRPLWGLAGTSAAQALGAAAAAAPGSTQPWRGGTLLRLADALPPDGSALPRWLWAAPAGTPDSAAAAAGPDAAPAEGLPALEPEAWRGLEACSGVARVVGATAEQFVPQMVNLELVGGVNFQKGCYPGQEVVARSQYRGTLKRRAFLLTSDALAQPGQEVFAADDPGQPAGMVANAGAWQGLGVALVELKIAAAEQPLSLGAPDGPPLRRAALPYAWPTEPA
jgi:folate-binding protein YgfZ